MNTAQAYAVINVFERTYENGIPAHRSDNPVVKELLAQGINLEPEGDQDYLAYYSALEQLTSYPSVALSINIGATLYKWRADQLESFDSLSIFTTAEENGALNFTNETCPNYLGGGLSTLLSISTDVARSIFTHVVQPLWEGKGVKNEDTGAEVTLGDLQEGNMFVFVEAPLVWRGREYKFAELELDAMGLSVNVVGFYTDQQSFERQNWIREHHLELQ